jgi:hypothetical protein
MTVRNVNEGRWAEEGGFYLNSFPDYKDARSLNVIVSAKAAAELAARGVSDPRAEFLNQRILVRGLVRKTEIQLVDATWRRTGESYFQTQLAVTEARQIEREDSGRRPEAASALRSDKATTGEYLERYAGDPALALYMEALGRRISELYQGEIFVGLHGEGLRLAANSVVRLQFTVFPDGRIGADEEDLKRLVRQQPELSSVVLRVLMKVTEKPVPFPEILRKTYPRGIGHDCAFFVQ